MPFAAASPLPRGAFSGQRRTLVLIGTVRASLAPFITSATETVNAPYSHGVLLVKPVRKDRVRRN